MQKVATFFFILIISIFSIYLLYYENKFLSSSPISDEYSGDSLASEVEMIDYKFEDYVSDYPYTSLFSPEIIKKYGVFLESSEESVISSGSRAGGCRCPVPEGMWNIVQEDGCRFVSGSNRQTCENARCGYAKYDGNGNWRRTAPESVECEYTDEVPTCGCPRIAIFGKIMTPIKDSCSGAVSTCNNYMGCLYAVHWFEDYDNWERDRTRPQPPILEKVPFFCSEVWS